eukprot:9414758-Pyramimonas_sp.AAC.1
MAFLSSPQHCSSPSQVLSPVLGCHDHAVGLRTFYRRFWSFERSTRSLPLRVGSGRAQSWGLAHSGVFWAPSRGHPDRPQGRK